MRELEPMAGTRPAVQTLLRRLGLFKDLTPAERDTLEALVSREVAVEADRELGVEGEEKPPVHLIESGWAARFKLLDDGRRQILNFLLPGDFAGLQAGLFGIPNDNVLTLTPVRAHVIQPAALAGLFDTAPRVAAAVSWAAAREEAMMADHIVRLGRRTAYERTSHLLLELLQRMKRIGEADDNSYRLPVSQEVLGDMLGLSVVHVNRTLRRLRDEGTITMEGRNVVLEDKEHLEDTGDFAAEHLDHTSPPGTIMDNISAETPEDSGPA